MATDQELNWIKKYHRITNYVSAAMLYLKDNYLLKDELKPEHIKNRVLGHWGTVPGLNLIYAGLNYYVSKYNKETMLIVGPGHGAPSVLANLYFEGTFKQFYPKLTFDYDGLGELIKQFSWPGGFPSHTYPGIPGTIHEGGELGYSLGISFGAALDNPNLTVACVVGDGEAETGPLSAAWQSNKFLNPRLSGKVLPILHLNGYRISGPTIFGTLTDNEITSYFTGLGYAPIIVDQYKSDDVYKDFLSAIDAANTQIQMVCDKYDGEMCPCWPVIILRTKKGWTCPVEINGIPLEDHNNSHGIPLKKVKTDEAELKALESWLKSYGINELFKNSGHPVNEIFEFIPKDDLRIGINKHTYGWKQRKNLVLPDLHSIHHEEPVKQRGANVTGGMAELGEYLRDVFYLNQNDKNFRVFSPDETESNKLSAMYEATGRRYLWPVRNVDKDYSHEGRIMEILSEHVLQEWFEGYVKTGRHGVLISYEAFLGVITTQIDQYIKYVKQSHKTAWRKPLSSMNYIATSTGWRQDHNGFSHQNPTLINTLLTKYFDNVSVYLPADINVLLASMDDSFNRIDSVNLIVSGKRDLPQWLTMDEAIEHVKNGISIWEWAGNTRDEEDGDQVDVILASAGDYQTQETLAAAQLLRQEIPELKFQYVNVNELTQLGIGDEHNPVMTSKDIKTYFTGSKSVIFNFHGYPQAIKMLTWGTELSNRLTILGYIEEGTTTTPFDMQVQNKASRYHVAIQAVMEAAKVNPEVRKKELVLVQMFQEKLTKHSMYIREHGDDIPEVKEFTFTF